MTIRDIPALNASLNALATVLITAGFLLIKFGKKEAHRKVMTAAMVVSAVFLVGYVTHKILIRGVHTPFGGEGLSGTGPKAGGPHYLYRFCAEQTVTINTAAAGGNAELLAGLN